MNPDVLKNRAEKAWELYQPENIIAGLIKAGAKEIEYNTDHVKKFAEKNEIATVEDSDEVLSNATRYYKYQEIFRDPEVAEESDAVKKMFELPNGEKVAVEYHYYDSHINKSRLLNNLRMTKIDANGEVIQKENEPFYVFVDYQHYYGAQQVSARAFTTRHEFENGYKTEVHGANAISTKQYDFLKDDLIESTYTNKHTKVVFNFKDFDKRYIDGKSYTHTIKKYFSTYSQATEINTENEKELTLSFQLMPKNGIMVPMSMKRKENGDFMINYISTTPDTIYWEYKIDNREIKIDVKEHQYNRNLKHQHELPLNPTEFDFEMASLGNQRFYQDQRTVEEIVGKLPKMMELYDSIVEKYQGNMNNITQEISSVENMFTSLKHMSYSKRIKKENETLKP